jgi:hypothetical protein
MINHCEVIGTSVVGWICLVVHQQQAARNLHPSALSLSTRLQPAIVGRRFVLTSRSHHGHIHVLARQGRSYCSRRHTHGRFLFAADARTMRFDENNDQPNQSKQRTSQIFFRHAQREIHQNTTGWWRAKMRT